MKTCALGSSGWSFCVKFIGKHKGLAPFAATDVGDPYLLLKAWNQACGKSCIHLTARALPVYSLEEIGYHREVEVFNHYVFFDLFVHICLYFSLEWQPLLSSLVKAQNGRACRNGGANSR